MPTRHSHRNRNDILQYLPDKADDRGGSELLGTLQQPGVNVAKTTNHNG
jgi:hypothetical protein